MPWQQLIVGVTAEHVSAVESLLEAAGAGAVSLGDAADVPVLEPEPGETPLWPTVTIAALFPADADLRPLRHLLHDALGDQAEVTIVPLADSAWQRAACEPIAAQRIGPRLSLCAADDRSAQAAADCVRLHMGLAFGTGRHSTTMLCLEWLEARFEAGDSVLDFGCGSGVLALAALQLGASAAWAVDNDPQALIAAERNAELNGASGTLWIGPPASLPRIEVDVLLANILARPLIERAAQFAARVRPGGVAVLSGVLQAQQDDVVGAYEPWFENASIAERDGWVRIVTHRRPAAC